MLEKLTMEFLGTFFSTLFLAIGSAQVQLGNIDELSFALLAFSTLATLTWVGKHVSLAQYNPLISGFLVVSRHIKPRYGLFFILVQSVATFFALCVFLMVVSDSDLDALKISTNLGFPKVKVTSVTQSIILEGMGSFLLVFIYYLLVLERSAPKYVYAGGVGAVWFVLTLKLYKSTGCGINPLRMLSYAVLSNNYENLHVYLIGDVVGGGLGSIVGNLMLTEKAEAVRAERKEESKKTNENKELIE